MADDRSKQIIDYLKQHNLVTVNELVQITGASAATIRRELVRLDKDGVVYRVHGGVTLHRFVADQPTTSQKERVHPDEKAAIAAAAVKLIKPNDAIVLDAGTTTIQIARGVLHMPLRVITNDLRIGLLLAEYQQIETSLTGGSIDWSSQSCIGPHATSFLQTIHPTITFVSCNAFSVQTGITAPTFDKAYMKRTLLHQSGRRVLVADSSKYGVTQLFEVGPLADLDVIITDKGLNAAAAEEIRTQGIELILC
ncbi:MAG: DeoR/GlpR transcriptional regulator [Proteobacteria bacterium]|uniref:DeoR/GlpR transcriptional regulator n=1 Tax=Candidatus Avisuccinivibrio stercorigallinarum TaxID=2840704 RepID=A0A9D9DA07_9GAMM|nr:DeoR/GlpR transcriptional regulator [Candidatus Avisuccinivibrio stercorigallinarum]